MTQATQIHSSFGARNIKAPVAGKDYALDEYMDLSRIGICGLNKIVEKRYAMDTIQQGVTTPSVVTPVQFLQNWLPGFVNIITAARKIDDIVGIATAGAWMDEQVVQGVMENTGYAVPYGDYTNVPLASYNVNFVTRTVVRFETGMRVGVLEEQRVAAIRVNADAAKRESAALALDNARNQVGFYGYNSGNNNTYGFLNDPNLPSYITVATGGTTGSKLWSVKNFAEICADIRSGLQALRTQSQDVIDPNSTPITLAVAMSRVDYLSVTTDFGISVMDWLKQTYPNVRVTSAPQLDSANGGANVFYLFAESVPDLSSDDGRTFIQIVPAKFQVVGVQKLAKGYEEDYSNATAGIMCKRPYAIYRATGI